MATRNCFLAMAIPFLLVLFTVLVDLTRAQLNLPEMPGPPYPDRWGNNRWGVKYDPRVHGRGSRPARPQSSSASSSSGGLWGDAAGAPENTPSRYRGGRDWSPPYSQHHNHQSSRGKWAPGLKPLVSSLTSRFKHRNRRPPHNASGGRDTSSYSTHDPTNNDGYTSKAIHSYVKNYLDHYSTVAQTPSASSDLVNTQNFGGPQDQSDNFRPKNFASFGRKPGHVSSDRSSSTSFVQTSREYKREPRSRGSSSRSDTTNTSSSKARYRTYNAQTDLFGPSTSSNRNKNFAKTLSNIYNDYKPGAENTVSSLRNGDGSSSSSSSISNAASDSISNSILVTDEELDPYVPHPPSYSSSRPSRPRPTPSRPRPKPSAVRPRDESSFGPSNHSKRPRRPPTRGKGRPLSALDLFEETQGEYSFSGPDYSSAPLYDGDKSPFSDIRGSGPLSPNHPINSGGGRPNGYSSGFSGPGYSESDSGPSYSFGSSGGPGYPLSNGGGVGGPSYSGHGPYNNNPVPLGENNLSPHTVYSYDIYDMGPGPGPMSSPPLAHPHPHSPHGLNYIPPSSYYYSPPSYPPNKRKPKRKNKNRSQHTPMNILRGLLGRGDNKRAYANLQEHAYSQLSPHGIPPVVPHHPPQFAYNPLWNSLSGGLDFMDRPRDPLHPRPHPPPSHGGLLGGLAGLTGLRDRPPHHHHQRPHPFQGISRPHGPLGSRLPPPHQPPPNHNGEEGEKIEEDLRERERDPLRDPNEYKTAYHNWPRIFTAVGSTVDAVAGGIHAARKEVSKMTGQAVAKGIMMGGTAVHEVSKGMATVITKMSKI
ncbi:unnamed protein product [Orchesella dallaii]|uniref:Uncharacterized protein n=1 Tax=Orchesella dallaii TaxID=48710 RepID=A0ABP1RDR1_9HEXA